MVTLSGCCSSCVGPFVKTKGTPAGQHWLRGFGSPMPLSPSSPCLLTTSTASGFKIGLVSSPASLRISPVPFGRRDRLTSAVGPDGSGSNPGSGCTQTPDKSGTDAPPSSPLPVGLSEGAPACPKAGVTITAATANARGKFRHCESIALLLRFPRVPLEVSPLRLYLLCGCLEGGDIAPGPLHRASPTRSDAVGHVFSD